LNNVQCCIGCIILGGDLASSTLITLVVVPVVYSLFEGRRKKAE
jgi:Cu/Ag efflux pump CusA